jgi:TolB-like protein/Tfp pilus assembly protein PilF
VTGTSEPTARGTWRALRRRKVVQWGLAYVAVSWGLVQGIAFAVGTFGWPEPLTRIAAVVAVIGLPVAITLAWFHGDRGEQRVARVELVVLALLLALGTYTVVREARQAPRLAGAARDGGAAPAHRARDRHRIAILPFDNLGGIATNSAFVGGVHDTLITQVAKVPGLSVISRSSVLQFADRHPTIAEVAAALDVGAVLEGSVEREGDRLRIQAQLIDAGTDVHLWAETYDRRTDDLFAVQSEIARAVAEQLRIRLTGNDGRRIKAALSSSPAAYEHYVLGRNHAGRRAWPEAIRELTAAVTLDPQFAAAYAYLSLAHTWQAFEIPRLRADVLPTARDEASKALSLDPALPESHLAMAVYLYRGEPDIDRAAAEFERAIAGLPNDAAAHLNFGYLRRWQGRWEEAAVLWARAAELDPYGPAVADHVISLVTLGRRDEAARAIDAAAATRPDDVNLALWRGDLALNFSCDLATQQRVIREVTSRFPESPDLLMAQAYFALQTGDAGRAVNQLDRMTEDMSRFDVYWYRALAYRASGRPGESNTETRKFIQGATRELRDLPQDRQHSDELASVAKHYALLGDSKAAHEYVERSLKALPPTGDAANRADTLYGAAIALAWAGDPQQAVAHLRQLLSAPAWQKPSYLWCDPSLAPLRSDPGFRKLMAEHGADVRIDPLRRETWPKP